MNSYYIFIKINSIIFIYSLVYFIKKKKKLKFLSKRVILTIIHYKYIIKFYKIYKDYYDEHF